MSTYKKKYIEDEYNSSANSAEEFEKVKWGSKEKMYNRFSLAKSVIDFNQVSTWLDVGSGTGAFQSIINKQFPTVKATGIDISSELIKFAKSRRDVDHSNVSFYKSDFQDYFDNSFDLITCVGVLQKTNISKEQFFDLANRSLNLNGKIFLDTKNKNWVKFKEPDFYPETTLTWFDIDELILAAEDAGFSNIIARGFDPGENTIVKPNESHTIFLTAEKTS